MHTFDLEKPGPIGHGIYFLTKPFKRKRLNILHLSRSF